MFSMAGNRRAVASSSSPVRCLVLLTASACALLCGGWMASEAHAQDGRRGRPMRIEGQALSPEDIARMQAAQGMVQPEGGQPGPQPGGEKPKDGEEKKPDDKGEKKEEESKTI